MNKCVDCGHLFDDVEAAVREERHPYGSTTASEYFVVCPICGGDFEETKACKKCGGAFFGDDLIGDYCPECLKECVTFGSFLEFATTGVKHFEDVDTLEDFMLRVVFEIGGNEEILVRSSSTFKSFLRNSYAETVNADEIRKRFTGKGTLIDSIRKYLTDFKLWDDFSEYLHEKEVRK